MLVHRTMMKIARLGIIGDVRGEEQRIAPQRGHHAELGLRRTRAEAEKAQDRRDQEGAKAAAGHRRTR